MHNYSTIMEKVGAFKPDDYGKHIVIEKTLYKEGVAKLVLKNDKDKRVSERKQELDEILEHFGIQINNPICILNQEVSKTFLHSKRPEDKFELFMKATDLEQIQQDYALAKETHTFWKDCNQRKNISFRMLQSEHESCKEKISFIRNRLKLTERAEQLCKEAEWATVRDFEIGCKKQSAILGRIPEEIRSTENEIVAFNSNIVDCEKQIEVCTSKTKDYEEACERSKKKINDIRSHEMKIKTSRIDIKHKIDTEKNYLQRLQAQKSSLERKIEDLRRKYVEADVTSAENERRKLEIERLEREIPADHARERSIQLHTESINRSMADLRTELHRANMQLSESSNSMSAKQAMLRRLRGGQESELKKYGDGVVRFVDEINHSDRNGKFTKKPIGPLGYYIKLKSPDVAQALEQCLGRNAHAFTCDNFQDMQVLNELVKKVKLSYRDQNFREPLIITRPFGKRHDIEKFRAKHHLYKTLLDYINIENDAAANALLDRANLESILFIPDYVEAENLMITPNLIPPNTRCAYTKDCCVMYPRTATGGYRCVNNPSGNLCLFSKENEDQIRQIEQTIDSFKNEIRTAEDNVKRIQEKLSSERNEYECNKKVLSQIFEELRKKETQLLNLKTTMNNAIPPEISGYEDELERCLTKIVNSSLAIEERSTEIAKVETELSEIEEDKRSMLGLADHNSKELRGLQQNIIKTTDNIKEFQLAITSSHKKIDGLKKQMELEATKLEKYEKDLEASLSKLSGTERPTEVRDSKTIKDEYDDIQRQLSVDIDMNADADETLAALRKRMQEIEDAKALREHNQKNFELSDASLNDRDDGFKSLRSNTVSQVSNVFSSMMKAMGMNGMLNIHLQDQIIQGELVHKGNTLEMHIDPAPLTQKPSGVSESRSNLDSTTRRSRSQPGPSGDAPRAKRPRVAEATAQEKENIRMTDTRSLSGGERSFSTVAFVLSLWHLCSSPFKLMDEIDVFMDMVTRRLSYSALIKFASKSETSGQFVFFSPLELPKIDAEEGLVRVFEMPRIVMDGTVG